MRTNSLPSESMESRSSSRVLFWSTTQHNPVVPASYRMAEMVVLAFDPAGSTDCTTEYSAPTMIRAPASSQLVVEVVNATHAHPVEPTSYRILLMTVPAATRACALSPVSVPPTTHPAAESK